MKLISAATTSLPAPLTKLFLEDAQLATEDVIAEAMENEGPSGTPFFIFSRDDLPKRKIVFSGVQTPATFLSAFDNLSL